MATQREDQVRVQSRSKGRARYIELRRQGMSVVDAGAKTAVSLSTRDKWERWYRATAPEEAQHPRRPRDWWQWR